VKVRANGLLVLLRVRLAGMPVGGVGGVSFVAYIAESFLIIQLKVDWEVVFVLGLERSRTVYG